MRKVDLSTVTVRRHRTQGGPMDYSVGWNDGERRYHVWLNDERQPDDYIHSNPFERGAKHDHRALARTAKVWREAWAAIMAHIEAERLFEKADAERAEAEKAEAAKVAAAAAKHRQERAGPALYLALKEALDFWSDWASRYPDQVSEAEGEAMAEARAALKLAEEGERA